MTMVHANILIVDDEPHNRKLLEALLQPEGYLTTSVVNGEEALASVALHAPDLILLDAMMPGMNGYEVATILKTDPATASIPIVMVTAQIDRAARLAGLESGAEEFLTKPVDRAELWVRVRNLLRLKSLSDFHQKYSSELKVELRASELFAQATIDSVSAHICVLDETGKIVAVNLAWCDFCRQNNPKQEEFRAYLGSNYLGICAAVFGPDAPRAQAMATGIREVMDGALMEFTLEFPCHSPTELRWFLARVTRFRDPGSNVVIAHENITELKQALHVMEASEIQQRDMLLRLDTERARLVAAQRVAKVGSWETDLVTLSINWSEETHRIHETDSSLFHPTHQGFLGLVHPEDREDVDTAFAQSLDQHHDNAIEHRLLLASGQVKHVEERWQITFDAQGKAVKAIGTCQDVTERKYAEIGMKHLNRVYTVLSEFNALTVRVRNRDELFRDACRIAVENGGFRMTMIAMVDQATKKIVPIATAGKNEELLQVIRSVFASDEKAPTTMAAQAIRDKIAIISNDTEIDPRALLREHYTRAGVHSLAFLPLMVSGEAVGILALYAREKDFFHDEEMKLLTELADDVALAIDHIGQQERLDYLASYDPLTGLANRRQFIELLGQRTRIAADTGHRLALVTIDLERFKNFNDSLGQQAGDALLQQVGEWLTQYLGDAYRVARVAADQFAVVLPEKHAGDVPRHLEAMIDAFLSHAFRLDDEMYRVAAKFGGAIFPDDGADADILFKNAEAALKKAKEGGHRHLFYTPKMTETVAQRLNLENQLRQALEKEEFVLHYQPKVSLASGEITGVEALIRWNDPRTGLVPLSLFIPILEETGLIYDVGRWALHQSLKDYLRWRATGLHAVRIAVNVSPLQLRHPGFIAVIEQLVATHAHAAQGVELEITEGMIMNDMKQAISSLDTIRALGIPIAIDDFGTGFSSLGYLSKLPIDTLKIDRMFVTDMTTNPQGLSLVSTIINLAHSLEFKVVAEGVETDEESRLLKLLRCDEIQGYLFSKPVPTAIL
ncbi:MAG: EAL domain-containing protein, partial [Lysobacteraceae bacterium]